MVKIINITKKNETKKKLYTLKLTQPLHRKQHYFKAGLINQHFTNQNYKVGFIGRRTSCDRCISGIMAEISIYYKQINLCS